MDYPDEVFIRSAFDDDDDDEDEDETTELPSTKLQPESQKTTELQLSSEEAAVQDEEEATEEEDSILETTEDAVFVGATRIKEEVMESCTLVGEEELPGIILEESDILEGASILVGANVLERTGVLEGEQEEELEEQELGDEPEEEEEEETETHKQLTEIREENDEAVFEEDFKRYLKTESADRAAIHSTITRQCASNLTYSATGFLTIEMFPKKHYDGYYLVVDGHKLTLNTKRDGQCIYRCKFHSVGCKVRYQLKMGFFGKINDHTCTDSGEKGTTINYHYYCIYCSEKFDDLAARKKHMLTVAHNNAPWPMDEELCLFAEIGSRDQLDKENPIPVDKHDDIGATIPLPNNTAVADRLFINNDNWICIFRPGEAIPPIYPKEEIPKDIPIAKKRLLHLAFDSPVNSGSETESVLKIRNSNQRISKKRKHRSSFPVPAQKHAKSEEEEVAKCVEETWVSSSVEQEENIAPPVAVRRGRGRPRKKKKEEEEEDEEDEEGASPQSVLRDDESKSVSQRIDNVIEEYENKVVLFCDLCSVTLTSLKHQADHDLSEEHTRNKRLKLEREAEARASLAFDKAIFTPEFLVYNKALEAELRSLRKGAVELEEQNAVLSSHISELNDVVKELTNAKAIMQRQHVTLDSHLKDLKAELSKVFANVLSTEVSAENFNETFNKLSVAITGKQGKKGYDHTMQTKLKRHLEQARIDTIML